MRVPNTYLDSLAHLGGVADLEFEVRMTLRRGVVRTIICTAGTPMDSDGERHQCGYVFQIPRDTVEVIQALCIESAVRWREPVLPGSGSIPIAWFDDVRLGLRPAGRR